MTWNKQIPSQFSLAEMKREIVREIKMRQACYPRWYESGSLKLTDGEYRILCLEAVALELDKLIKEKSPQRGLFSDQEIF